MSGFDKTGPEVEGPMSGRRIGRCTGYGTNFRKSDKSEYPEDSKESYGRRRFRFGWRGLGRGMGFRDRFRGGVK